MRDQLKREKERENKMRNSPEHIFNIKKWQEIFLKVKTKICKYGGCKGRKSGEERKCHKQFL